MGRPVAAWMLVVVVITTGCRTGLAFQQDDRLTIVAPAERSVVTVPFHLDWDARALPADVKFAVLVDRIPPPPGQDLGWLSRHDPACEAIDCEAAAHLRTLRVQVTDATEVSVDSVPRPVRPGRDLHDVTVIVLDGAGRRLGETVATVRVEVDRGT